MLLVRETGLSGRRLSAKSESLPPAKIRQGVRLTDRLSLIRPESATSTQLSSTSQGVRLTDRLSLADPRALSRLSSRVIVNRPMVHRPKGWHGRGTRKNIARILVVLASLVSLPTNRLFQVLPRVLPEEDELDRLRRRMEQKLDDLLGLSWSAPPSVVDNSPPLQYGFSSGLHLAFHGENNRWVEGFRRWVRTTMNSLHICLRFVTCVSAECLEARVIFLCRCVAFLYLWCAPFLSTNCIVVCTREGYVQYVVQLVEQSGLLSVRGWLTPNKKRSQHTHVVIRLLAVSPKFPG